MQAMKRTIKIQPSAILTSDWHLRLDQPICRTDNFLEAQTLNIGFINGLQKKYQCPIIHAGDLFHYWKATPELLTYAFKYLPGEFKTIFGTIGNHDLPGGSMELHKKSAVYTLAESGRIELLGDASNEEYHGELKWIVYDRRMLILHTMTYPIGKQPWPNCIDPSSRELLKKYHKEYDIIVTGHYHKPFIDEYKGSILVNPGSLTQQEANEGDLKPSVYLWFVETNTVKRIKIPINTDVISRKHIERIKRREIIKSKFANKLDLYINSEEDIISFKKDLEQVIQKNRIRKPISDIIWRSME